jgi:hypothetical protein
LDQLAIFQQNYEHVHESVWKSQQFAIRQSKFKIYVVTFVRMIALYLILFISSHVGSVETPKDDNCDFNCHFNHTKAAEV